MSTSATTTKGRGFSGRWVLIGALVVLVAAVVVIAIPTVFGRERYVPTFREIGPVPAFEFTDQTNQRVSSAAMMGRVSVVNFIFTRCDLACPASTARMLEVQQRTEDLDQKVQLLSFSVDPGHDSPEVLARYAKDFHADPRRWRFLTGPLAEMKAAVDGQFKVGMDDLGGTTASGAPNIWHGEAFLLVDKHGQIRDFYQTDPVGLDRLVRDARYLATRP
jgi:protein SCO1